MKTNIIMHKCLEVGPTAVASWLIDNFPSVDPRRPLLQSALSHHSQCDLRYLQHLLNWLIQRHNVVTSEALFLPIDRWNHIRYSLHPPTEGWPGWVGLAGLDKYRNGKPA